MGLHDCVVAVMGRDTSGLLLTEAQRIAHFPSYPYIAVGALLKGQAEMHVREHTTGEVRSWISPPLTVTGPFTHNAYAKQSRDLHNVIVLFYPHAWQRLSGMCAQDWVNRHVDCTHVLHAPLLRIFETLWTPGDDAERLALFFERLKPFWQYCRGNSSEHDIDWGHSPAESLQTWMRWLAMRAAGTGVGRSLRQTERRFRQWTGTSHRTLNKRVRAEQAFFAAMQSYQWSKPDWAELALRCGYADQSHFIRDVQDVTGFAPQAFHDGLLNEESFAVYRAWAMLLGADWPCDQAD